MLLLLAIFAFLLLAGSLFPWNFRPGPDLAQAAWNVAASWRHSLHVTSARDLLVNLVIYVPIGFTGYLWHGWNSRGARWTCPLLAGLALSFSIETLQHYFPPRAPGIVDVISNTLSTLLGLALAAVFHSVLESRQISWRRRHSIHLSSALLLIALWISASGWPMHAFPLGIVLRIRALLRPEQWTPLEAMEGALPWLLAGCLLTVVTDARMARWWLAALLPGIFLLRILAPGHAFTWSHLSGAVAAVFIFWNLPERHHYPKPWLAALWLTWIVLEGLRPFTTLTTPHHFGWVPFQDMITSSWMPSIGVLLRKTWMYGAAFWLLTQTCRRPRLSFPITLLTVLVVEAAQLWLPGRSPGLTDPAIALLAASLLWLVDRRFATATHQPG